jgi:hypothetical protein
MWFLIRLTKKIEMILQKPSTTQVFYMLSRKYVLTHYTVGGAKVMVF